MNAVIVRDEPNPEPFEERVQKLLGLPDSYQRDRFYQILLDLRRADDGEILDADPFSAHRLPGTGFRPSP